MKPYHAAAAQTLRPSVVALAAIGIVGACAKPIANQAINDPYEQQNRAVHGFNVAFDRTLFGDGKTTRGIIPTIPKPIAIGFSNAASNLGMPSVILNNLLQGDPLPAAQNTLRFAVNTIVGIGGIFDPASALGVDKVDADFGQTLHVWGVAEGAYVEAPFLGPSTERDLAGWTVDMVIDPINFVINWKEAGYATITVLTSKAGNRQRFAESYETILYDSADSYAQARLMYLQSRHYELGMESSAEDPYQDPYEDPNAQ